MIHACNIHCHTMDLDQADLMGLKDKGKWLPFAFHMDIVVACKLTTDDEEEESLHGCTTVFTDSSDTYIIDTPYEIFLPLFQMYYAPEEKTGGTDSLNF